MIRKATSADTAPVTALIRAAYGEYVALLGRNPQPMDDDYGTLIDAGEVFVLEIDAVLTGVLVIQATADGAMLVRTVGLAPGDQRRGFGTKLMAYAEQVADGRGLSRMRLYTNEVMDGTEHLCARLGYAGTHRAGAAGKQVIYMTKEVPPGRTPW